MAMNLDNAFIRISRPEVSKTQRTPRLPRDEWTKYQRIIKDLYIDQDKTLDEVVHTMRQDHKFHARYDMVNTRQRSND